MRAAIFYFSGTYNTLKICKEYRQNFESRGILCELLCVTDFAPFANSTSDEKLNSNFTAVGVARPQDYDYVGFAYPVHAFNAPYVMYRFVRALSKISHKNVFLIMVSGEALSLNNSSTLHFSAKLRKKGFFVTNEYHYVMPYNLVFRHTDLTAQKMWRTARALVAVDIEQILMENHSLLPKPLFGRIAAWALRIEQPAMRLNGRFFNVTDACVHCNKCIRNCPVHNISYDDQSEKFRFGGNCVMCARCAFECPCDAIKIGLLNGWKVNGAYNFAEPDLTQKCKKPNYCKRSYARYFRLAEEKISCSSGIVIADDGIEATSSN